MKHLIGIDLGTTAAKCAIYGEDGTCAADATEDMKIRYPRSGEAEQDAMDFYTVSCRLIRECLGRAAIDPKSIAGIAIDSQMGGIMSVDRHFDPSPTTTRRWTRAAPKRTAGCTRPAASASWS